MGSCLYAKLEVDWTLVPPVPSTAPEGSGQVQLLLSLPATNRSSTLIANSEYPTTYCPRQRGIVQKETEKQYCTVTRTIAADRHIGQTDSDLLGTPHHLASPKSVHYKQPPISRLTVQ